MNQHFATEVLSAYLDGELAAAEAQSLQAHLALCSLCAERLQALHATAAALRTLERPAPPSVVTERLRRQLAAERQRRPRPLWLQALLPWRMLQPGLAAAALVFVTALLTLLHFERVASRDAEVQASASRQRSLEEREQEAAAAPTVLRPVPDAPAQSRRSEPELPAALPPEPSARRADAPPELGAAARPAEVESAPATPLPAGESDSEAAGQSAAASASAVGAVVSSTADSQARSAAAASERADRAKAAPTRYPRPAARAAASPSPAPIGTERAAAGRVLVRVEDRWLERGVALAEGPVQPIGRNYPFAVDLLRRWPELEGLLADRLPVRMRYEDRIIELLP